MSLRKVATALETGPASLYAYVDDLQELQALVLDRALGSVDTRGAKRGAWRANLESLLASYLEVLFASPGLAQLALSAIAVGPSALRITERFLGLLGEAGADRRTAAWAADLFLLYATALAAELGGKASKHDPTNPQGAVARAVRGVSAGEYPHIHAAREELLSGGGGQRLAWVIEVLLKGILSSSEEKPKRGKVPGH
jgi:AcrR family transcriptional regulator